MAGMSPTRLTLRHLRNLGYQAEVTEKWNSFAGIRQDLFGFVDVLAVSSEGTVAVQTTSYSNISARVKKIRGHPHLQACLDAGWTVVVHGWRKVKNRWQVKEVTITHPEEIPS